MNQTTTLLIMVVLFAGMGGCISPVEETDAPYVLHIRTSFVPEESDERAMVPEGTPAAGARFTIGPRTLIDGEVDSPPPKSWRHDSPCPYRQIDPGRAPGFYDCEGHPAREDVVLPAIGAEPEDRGSLAYPLPSDGEITVRSYESYSARFGLWGPYSDELMGNRIHPENECEPYVILVRGEGYRDAQGIEARAVGRGVIIDFSGVGAITLLWMGYCRDDDDGTS